MTNKPMLSVEREHRLKIHRKPFLDLESGAKTCEIRDCSDRDFQVGDSVLLMLVDETGNPTPNELLRKITHIQTGYGLPDDLCVLSYGSAAQHQGAPVVGHCTHPPGCKSCSWCGFKAEQPAPVADSTTSDKYKAELYGEVWQLARSMGFNNVTDALTGRAAPLAVQITWSDVEPWYLANEQRLSDIRKFEGSKGFALEVWRGARLNGVKQ